MLNALAERLKVRTITDVKHLLAPTQKNARFPEWVGGVRYDYRDVPEEVKKMFVSLLQQQSGEFSFGNCYSDTKRKRGYSMSVYGANPNLEKVFQKLPPLAEGEEYAFPCDTCFFLPMPTERGKRWASMSLWVQAAVKKAKDQ